MTNAYGNIVCEMATILSRGDELSNGWGIANREAHLNYGSKLDDSILS